MKTKEDLFEYFSKHNLVYENFEHEPVFKVQDSVGITDHIPGGRTKNLFLKDDKKQFWLISALQNTTIKLKEVAKKLNAPGLRFAQPELLRESLGVEPGSVTWFALINDTDNRVNAFLDKNIFDYAKVGFHPLKNNATTVIAVEELKRFADLLGHPYRIYDFS